MKLRLFDTKWGFQYYVHIPKKTKIAFFWLRSSGSHTTSSSSILMKSYVKGFTHDFTNFTLLLLNTRNNQTDNDIFNVEDTKRILDFSNRTQIHSFKTGSEQSL